MATQTKVIQLYDVGTVKRCGHNVEELLTAFNSYMTGPDREHKCKSIGNIVDAVRETFLAVRVKDDISAVFGDFKNSVREKYLNNYCVDCQIKAGSIKTYLYALQDFSEVLLAESILVQGVSSAQLQDAVLKIEQWHRTYRTKYRVRTHVRFEEDLEMLVTSEQVAAY